MSGLSKPKNALISVFHKDGLEPIVKKLNEMGVAIYSTGGTQTFIEEAKFLPLLLESIAAIAAEK